MIVAVVVAAILFYAWRVHRSPYGRLLIAVGGNEPWPAAWGSRRSGPSSCCSASRPAAMGLLGAMSGVMARYLDVGSLGVGVTLAAMVGLVLGGTARVWGAVVGVVLTVGLFDIVIQSYLPLPKEWYTQAIPVLREAAFGLTLIIVLLFRPLGLLGDMRRDKLMRKIHGR